MTTQVVNTNDPVEKEAALGPCQQACSALASELALHQARLQATQAKLLVAQSKYSAILSTICRSHGVTPPPGASLSAAQRDDGSVDVRVVS